MRGAGATVGARALRDGSRALRDGAVTRRRRDASVEGRDHLRSRDPASLDTYCAAAGAGLVAVGVANDYVHALVRWEATARLCDVVQRMKGATSHAWNFERRGSTALAWQDGYWAQTVSPRDVGAARRYFREQRAHHATSTRPEAWELHFAHGLR